jgi:hypothetical protein
VFGSTVLDVVIGLMFIFFVFSLLVSGINEFVRKLLNTRSKVLWESIRRMLDEGEFTYPTSRTVSIAPEPTRDVSTGLAPPGSAGAVGVAGTDDTLFDQFFNHPIISRLDPTPQGKKSRITHIPGREFGLAMVDILAPRNEAGAPMWSEIEDRVDTLPAPLRSQFQVLLAEAQGDIKQFRIAIEGWFDSGMERVSDWYKKRSRKAMFAYGLLVAGLFNVSAVVITADLYQDEIIRETVVGLAEQNLAEASADATGAECADRACIEANINDLIETRVPVLWRQCPIGNEETRLCGFESPARTAASLIGWIVTAAALSMGAAFWFSLLKKAFEVRKTRQA